MHIDRDIRRNVDSRSLTPPLHGSLINLGGAAATGAVVVAALPSILLPSYHHKK